MCALLRLCQIDDQVEDPKSSEKKVVIADKEKEAAQDRITSEYESYPATLANVLMDASCFQPTLIRLKKQRRGKTMRQSDLETTSGEQQSKKSLTVHIIGASEEAELWGEFKLSHASCKDVYSAYADALIELASTYNGISTINLIFVGPNCPSKDVHEVRIIQTDKDANEHDVDDGSHKNAKKRKYEGSSCEVVIQSHRSNYDKEVLNKIPMPDLVVFFNPGFTCQDYKWSEALDVCTKGDTARRIPFLITTNTEMEAISDLQWLHQYEYIDELPAMVADIVNDDIVDHDADIADYSDTDNVFFGENQNSGSRVRQSGNMANDLFVKNRWIYGGLFSGNEQIEEKSEKKSIEKKKKSKLSSKKKKSNAALM